jgi:hypothetical protein
MANVEHSKGRISKFAIVDDNNSIVGTYSADIVTSADTGEPVVTNEQTSGERALLVDLIQDQGLLKTLNWKDSNGTNYVISDHTEVFKAKNKIGNDIPRDKDIRDFNSFYNSAFYEKLSDSAKAKLAETDKLAEEFKKECV